MKSDTEMVSPIELHIGDHVQRHGALFEVMHIVESECDIPAASGSGMHFTGYR